MTSATTDTMNGVFGASNDDREHHAIVIGGSVAGLLAARVLADYFERVTLIERDHLPGPPAFRKGIPHSRAPHVLLPGGLIVLRQLFPGIEQDMIAAGAVRLEWPREVLWLTAAGWSGRFGGRPPMLSQSRELLEWAVRQRVLAIPNVRLVQGHNVIGLCARSDQRGVGGVRIRRRPSADAALAIPEEIAAAVVIDASGRNSAAPDWLQTLGYEPPVETAINGFHGYASRCYAIPSDHQHEDDWQAIFVQAAPPHNTRSGILLPVEGNRWITALIGAGRDYPPTDEEDFLAFARSLRSPVLYDALRRAEPLSPIHGYQRTTNQRRAYDQMRRQPEGFLVTGDAACAFNPVYGQGLSVAAAEAAALDGCLRDQRHRHPDGDLTGLARTFQRAAAKCQEGAWLVASGEDLRFPTTEGGNRDVATRLTHRYLDRVLRVALDDADVHLAFSNVLSLLAPPSSLFKPAVLFPALLRGGRTTAPHSAEAPRGWAIGVGNET